MKAMSKQWIAPVAAAVAITAVVTVPRAFAATAHPALAPMSAAQLIVAAERSTVQQIQGTIETKANLGLPALPDRVVGSGAGFAALLTGTNRLQVWADGPQRQRLAVLGDLTETDVVHNGSDVWLYTSATNSVTHWTAPAGARSAPRPPDTVEQQLTPQAQAQRALHAIDPTTAVTVDRTARVAGRSAYQLVLTPRTPGTLIGSVRIALDAATYVPLRVQVFAAGATTPAWETAFTSVSFARPGASTFAFHPPAGATVTTHAVRPARGHTGVADHGSAGRTGSRPTVVGTGWASIAELPAGTAGAVTAGPQAGPGSATGNVAGLLQRMTRSVPEGRLLSTRLLSVLITPDGRVFVGAVPAASIERAAASARG